MIFETDIVSKLAGSGRLFAFQTSSFWSQIKTAGSAVYANRHYLGGYRRTRPDKLATAASGYQVVGDVCVDPTATVDPTAKLGPNVSIEAGVHIEAGARVRDSIILSGVTIHSHSCVLNSIIDKNSSVGYWARVEGAQVGVNPNDPTTDVPLKPLFNPDGRLEPTITIVGEEVNIADEIMVLNSIVLPQKELTRNYKNEIIL